MKVKWCSKKLWTWRSFGLVPLDHEQSPSGLRQALPATQLTVVPSPGPEEEEGAPPQPGERVSRQSSGQALWTRVSLFVFSRRVEGCLLCWPGPWGSRRQCLEWTGQQPPWSSLSLLPFLENHGGLEVWVEVWGGAGTALLPETVVGASLSRRATGHGDEGPHSPVTDVPEQTGTGYQSAGAGSPPQVENRGVP